MRKSFGYALRMLLLLVLTACASSPAVTVVPDPTSTPVPTETPPTEITLYRGNPQRTGVFDFPAIRQEPSIAWQAKVSSTWLMPPVLADGTLYTGSGDGVIYCAGCTNGSGDLVYRRVRAIGKLRRGSWRYPCGWWIRSASSGIGSPAPARYFGHSTQSASFKPRR